MKQIDMIEVRDAAELMRMVLGDRDRTALKEIRLAVSKGAKEAYDQAIREYAVKHGFSDIVTMKAPLLKSDIPSPTSIIFPGGLKVTVIEDEQV